MMKKLIRYLAGLGLGLAIVAGSFETSQAEEKDSLFQKYPLIREHFQKCPPTSEHLKQLYLRENLKQNSPYLKPGPIKPGKVAGEFLLGGVGAVLLGCAAARKGYSMTYDPDEGGFFNTSGLWGAILGYLLGSNLGCATGVYLIGNSGDEKGSYGSAFGGSLAGTFVGGLIAISPIMESANREAVLAVFSTAQAGVATLGFNSSRKKKSVGSLEALLNVNDGRLAFALPLMDVSEDSFSSVEYKVNLFQANF
jgi:hypothetical protein